MRYVTRCGLVLLLLVIFACASTSTRTGRKDRYLILADEIVTVPHANTVWDVIEILRPNLLSLDERRQVGFKTMTSSLVYVNGMYYGEKERLKEIPNLGILEIRFLHGAEAGAQYGYDTSGGVFLLTIE